MALTQRDILINVNYLDEPGFKTSVFVRASLHIKIL